MDFLKCNSDGVIPVLENIWWLAPAYSSGSQNVHLGIFLVLRIAQRCLELLKSSNINQLNLLEQKKLKDRGNCICFLPISFSYICETCYCLSTKQTYQSNKTKKISINSERFNYLIQWLVIYPLLRERGKCSHDFNLILHKCHVFSSSYERFKYMLR